MTTRPPGNHVRSSEARSRSSGLLERDPLSDVLTDLRLVDASYCRTEMHAPWGLEIPPEDGAVIHIVIEGTCWLLVPHAPPVELAAGDIVFLPRGDGHALVDAPGSPTHPIGSLARVHTGDATFRLHGAGPGPRALLVCCAVSFDAPMVHPVLQLMPELLHLRCARCRDPVLLTLVETMAAEVREQRIGAATVMARLADSVVARLVRGWAEEQAESGARWLAALRDPQIGRALAAFHRSPEAAWPIDALAAEAHLSRSQFSERFTAALGVAPARYVATWRMHQASRWLATRRLSIGEVASRLGYESEPAFRRAFKRIVGIPPGAARTSRIATDASSRSPASCS